MMAFKIQALFPGFGEKPEAKTANEHSKDEGVEPSAQQVLLSQSRREHILYVPVGDIRPNPYQSRLSFDDEGLRELKEDIKVRGVLGPVLLVKDTEGNLTLAAVERRLQAAERGIGGAIKLRKSSNVEQTEKAISFIVRENPTNMAFHMRWVKGRALSDEEKKRAIEKFMGFLARVTAADREKEDGTSSADALNDAGSGESTK
jgi:ParB/Sulfiredoxin domain